MAKQLTAGLKIGQVYRFTCENKSFNHKHKWFVIGRFRGTGRDAEGVERIFIEEEYSAADLILCVSSVKAVS